MKTLALTTLVMIAFAANSVLNRLALAGTSETGPAAFALLRLVSGALVLGLLVWLRRTPTRPVRPLRLALCSGTLAVYALGFSFAYVTLDAGVGALILFGGVQVTMFAGAVLSAARIGPARWAGAAIALSGLAWMLWPAGATAPDPLGAALMGAAAVGWGVYSLLGRGGDDPLADTTRAFLGAVPVALAVYVILPDGLDPRGAGLAVISGGVTSGLGYALWYRVLPHLDTAVAALTQLTVPVLALTGGIALLGEPLTLRFVISATLVLGGVALGVRAGR